MTATPTVDVTVRAIAAGGAGVGDLPDGRVVFVPRTAPGDRARIRVEKSKQRWAVGSLRRLLEPGADRREPPCPLYHTCGGCQLQHLPYARQLEWKARFVADALERIAGFRLDGPPGIVASPRELHYRNRLTFTLRRLRGGRVVAGFHALARPARVVDVRGECLLPEAPILDVWLRLREGWGAGACLLPDGGRLRLTLRVVGERVALLVEGGAPWRAAELSRSVPELAAIWHRPGDEVGQPAPLTGSGEAASLNAFAQVNREAAGLLHEHALGVAGAGARAVDAYCGAGAYGRALAERGWSVTGIELDRAACEMARREAPEGFVLLAGPVERLLAGALPADLLMLNPPRAGLHVGVTRAVLDEPPARLVYVSCDAATLARDLAALRGVYSLHSVRCFDLFPQTAHVETVVALDRAGRS